MATLQAARARALGLDPDEAKSWGLNRALFYAAAKRGWENARALGAKRPVLPEFEESRKAHDPVYVLGNERAFRSRDFKRGLRFKFAHEVQEPADFDRQVMRRFDDWDAAWDEAVRIVKDADRRDLDIQSRFFNNVYKPRRDVLSEKWSEPSKKSRAIPRIRRAKPSAAPKKRAA